MARPRDITPRAPPSPSECRRRSRVALVNRVLWRVVQGDGPAAIARREHMPRETTFRRWLRDRRLRARYDAALALQFEVMADDMIAAADREAAAARGRRKIAAVRRQIEARMLRTEMFRKDADRYRARERKGLLDEGVAIFEAVLPMVRDLGADGDVPETSRARADDGADASDEIDNELHESVADSPGACVGANGIAAHMSESPTTSATVDPSDLQPPHDTDIVSDTGLRDPPHDSPRELRRDAPHDSPHTLHDAPHDSPYAPARESTRNAPHDSPYDSPSELRRDAPHDSPRESTRNAPRDSPYAPAHELRRDPPYAPARESTRNAPHDSPSESLRDAPHDPPYAPARESTRNAPHDSPSESLRDAPHDWPYAPAHESRRNAPHDPPYAPARESTRNAPRDSPSESLRDAPHDPPYAPAHESRRDAPHDSPYAPAHESLHDAPHDSPSESLRDAPHDPPYAPARESTRNAPLDVPARDATAIDGADDAATHTGTRPNDNRKPTGIVRDYGVPRGPARAKDSPFVPRWFDDDDLQRPQPPYDPLDW